MRIFKYEVEFAHILFMWDHKHLIIKLITINELPDLASY